MYRTVPLLRSALPSLRATTPLLVRPTPLASKLAAPVFARGYSAAAGLSHEAITERVLDVLKSFEKVNADKLTLNSTFTSDLGLDSLDAVEVVMAIEEEFTIEIPDQEADEINSVQQAIDYVANTPEGEKCQDLNILP
ncbi:acyl carrier protein [Cryptococcus sp. DSM 104549]